MSYVRCCRSKLSVFIEPVVYKLRNNSVGQQLLYATGPRPSTYDIVKALAPTEMWPKLAASIAVDFIGCTSYSK
jgi:hypothetical protein